MGEDMATSGGSLHPGRPVIWPTGKSSSTAPTPQSSSGVQSSQQAAQAKQAKEVQTVQQQAQTQAAQKAVQQAVSRQYNAADLRELLISQNIAFTDSNEQLATMMLRYGVEVSKENFSKLSAMIGQDGSQSTMEASILLLMKGIESPAEAKMLSKFLAENPQIAAQLMSLKGNIQDLMSALSMANGIMTPQLVSQLASILAQFNDELDEVPGKFKFSGKGTMGRGELANNLRALKALLDGVPGKENLPDSAEGQVVESNINATRNRLDSMIQSIISQAMLSKQTSKNDVNYVYYQIPNAMTKPPTTVELIAKRSDSEGGKKIDPKDTQLIMSFETENMGKVAIKMTIKDKKVDFLFNTQNDEVKALFSQQSKDLALALNAKDYQTTKIQVNVNPSMCAIKPFLIPFLGIEDLMKIDVSV